VRKTRLARLIALLFPGVGAGVRPVVPNNGTVPDPDGLIAAIHGMNPFQANGYNAAANTTGFTLAGNQIAGAENNFLNLTGALTAAANVQLPTVANLKSALPANAQANPTGLSFQLRMINSSSGAFAWTVTTNTGWTLGGTMTLAQNTWRDFIVTFTSATTATLQAVGTGTNS